MNKKIVLLICLIISTLIYSQDGKITGKITNNGNNSLFGVSVSLKSLSKGTQTNEKGVFEITKLKDGDYTLLISTLGYKSKEISFSITNNDLVNLNTIIIYEGNELLNEVFIEGTRANKFSRKESAYVSKMPLKNIENSQVYNTVTNQLLVSQSVNSFQDALTNAAGVTKLWSSTGRSGDGAGYYSSRGFPVQPQLVNGVAGITNGFINPSNVERVEVIKGPSATLFGSSVTSYGGLINIITKKPYKGTGGEITVSGGSNDFAKLNLDVNISTKENYHFV